jgi:hypothetical protein
MKNINIIKTLLAISVIALSSAALAQTNTTGINVPPAATPTNTMANPSNPGTPNNGVNSTNTMNGAAGASCASGTPNCVCPSGSTTNCKIGTGSTPGTAY